MSRRLIRPSNTTRNAYAIDVFRLNFLAASVAVTEILLSRLWHAVLAFRTTSEIWLELLESYEKGGMK
jgi:hypothetical protein